MGLRTVVILDSCEFADGFDAPLAAALAQFADEGVDAVLLEAPRSPTGPIDPFVVLAAVAPAAPIRIGALIRLGQGRAASIAVREATSLEHLSAHGGILGFASDDPAHLAEALSVATALLTEERASVGGEFEHVVDAPNLPGPRRALELFGVGPDGVTSTGEPVTIRRLEAQRFG